MTTSAPLPWQAPQWERLMARVAAGTLPHALMFTGPLGVGKSTFAHQFMRALLCAAPVAARPCGECRDCMLYDAGNHPDAQVVAPPEPGKVIGIDAIRALSQALTLRPQLATHRAVLISPADQLNSAAANSLLKTLEEPTAPSVLILVTQRPDALPATIRSRCQQLAFPSPPPSLTLPWLASQLSPDRDPALLLALAGGAPLAALAMAADDSVQRRGELLADLRRLARGQADPIAVAELWLKVGPKQTLYWLHGWITDMIRMRMGGANPPVLGNPDIAQSLRDAAQGLEPKQLYDLLDRLAEGPRLLDGNISGQLVLEDVFIRWLALWPKAAHAAS